MNDPVFQYLPPLPGYGHHVRYGGRMLHVQTEETGAGSAQIHTHLFLGGAVVAQQQDSYRDLLGSPDLEAQLAEMMQAQHKQVLRRLRRGEYDMAIGLVAARVASGDAAPDEPDPALDVLRGFHRAREVSRELAVAELEGGTIPLEHPAFGAFPMLEMEEDRDAGALELDLRVISGLDLDAAARTATDEGFPDEWTLDSIDGELEPLASGTTGDTPTEAPTLDELPAVRPPGDAAAGGGAAGEELQLCDPDDEELLPPDADAPSSTSPVQEDAGRGETIVGYPAPRVPSPDVLEALPPSGAVDGEFVKQKTVTEDIPALHGFDSDHG